MKFRRSEIAFYVTVLVLTFCLFVFIFTEPVH